MPDLDEAFQRVWQAREDIDSAKLAEIKGVGQPDMRQQLRDWVDVSRRFHRQAVKSIGGLVLDEDDLLDLFSGMAIVPISLQVAGKIKRVTLLEHDTWLQFKNFYKQYPNVLGVNSPQVISDTITQDGSPNIQFPSLVTLVDTGLGLAKKDRDIDTTNRHLFEKAMGIGILQLRKSNPNALVRGHIFGLELNRILYLLSAKHRRLLIAERVIDNPNEAVERTRAHLTTVMEAFGGEWNVKDVNKPEEETGTVIAELVHE